MTDDASEETEEITLKSLPLKSIIIIFIVTFLLVFILFTMVEPYFDCPSIGGGCRLTEVTGNFVIGLMISGVLFLFDMLLLYMTLSEYFM